MKQPTPGVCANGTASPATWTANRRSTARVELCAFAVIDDDHDYYVLDIVNASRGGLFVAGSQIDCPTVQVGSVVGVRVVSPDSLDGDICATGTVVRADPSEGGRVAFGIAFDSFAPNNDTRLAVLLRVAGWTPWPDVALI